MRLAPVLIAVGCVLSAVLLAPGCAPRSGLSRAGKPRLEVPFTLRNGVVVLPVRVGSSRVLQVILDTGMGFDGVLLYEPVDDSAFLAQADSVQIPGAGAGAPARGLMLDSASFRVGDVGLTGQWLICVIDSTFAGFPTNGVIGYSLFGRWVVEIDCDRMVITLHDSAGFDPGPSWTAVPFELRENRLPWVKLRVSIDGSAEHELDCYIDLASREPLELLVRDDAMFRMPAGLEERYLGRGLSGDVRGWVGRVAWVELDTFRVDDIPAAFAPAAVRSKQPGADAVIGNGLLSRFNVAYDYAGSRLWLRRRQTAPGS